MKFSEFREKITSFLVPIIAIAWVLWGLIWLIGTTFFWDTSRLTIELPADEEVTLGLTVEARVIYRDFQFFGVDYPVHITFPRHISVTCQGQCVIDNIPAGDTRIDFITQDGDSLTPIFLQIDPDTAGTIDLRRKMIIVDVDVPGFTTPALPATPDFSNVVDNLYLFNVGAFSLYDGNTKQEINLAMFSAIPLAAARTSQDGVFLIWTGDSMHQFDRYGRSPITKITEFKNGDLTVSWSGGNTEINYRDEHGSINGIWFPTWDLRSLTFTDGRTIKKVEIRP